MNRRTARLRIAARVLAGIRLRALAEYGYGVFADEWDDDGEDPWSDPACGQCGAGMLPDDSECWCCGAEN